MIKEIGVTFFTTVSDVAPIVVLIAMFQILVIKKTIPNLKKVVIGVVLVILGLTFFLIGLEQALFPLGKIMAIQLSQPEFLMKHYSGSLTDWQAYYWIYILS